VTAGGNSQFPADLDCDQMLPKAEYFVDWRAPDFVEQFRVLLLGITGILTLVFALAGVTFAGADWSSGSIGTQLLFESRRGRVFGSKLGAITLVALVIGAVGVLLAWGASYWMASKWGTTALIGNDPVTGAQVPLSRADLVVRALRALALIGGGGAGGFALAMMFRSSLVAVGLVAGYGLVGEAVLRSVSSGVEPYLLSSRVAAFLDGQYLIYRYPNVCGTSGCEAEIIRISALQGGVYLGVLIVVVTVASLLLFRRRDVA
jgi:ABC-2 type transport system permease protein